MSGSYILFAASDAVVEPRKRAYVSTGVAATFPPGTCARIIYLKQLVLPYCIESCAGANNQVDSDYRGPIGVVLFNHGDLPFIVQVGDRIAQFTKCFKHFYSFKNFVQGLCLFVCH